jgi:hypothetical protein
MYASINHKIERLISNNVDMPVQLALLTGYTDDLTRTPLRQLEIWERELLSGTI